MGTIRSQGKKDRVRTAVDEAMATLAAMLLRLPGYTVRVGRADWKRLEAGTWEITRHFDEERNEVVMTLVMPRRWQQDATE